MDPMNYTPPTQPVPAPAPAYATSCLKAAWEDVKATPNYVSRLLVLGLIMCVPILNFVVAGYLLFWAREVPFGGRSLLPEKIVTGKNFEYGFYAFVLSLVVGLVGGIVGGIFGWIPFIGWVVSIAASLATYVAATVMQMRMIMGMSLGDGFNVKDIWEKGRRNWGQLLAVTLVPMAIVIGISLVLSIVVFSIMFLCIMGAAPTIAAIGSAADPSFAQIMSLIAALAGPMIFCSLILYVVLSVAETFAEAVAIRGMAHWVARYAPEWTTLDVPRY